MKKLMFKLLPLIDLLLAIPAWPAAWVLKAVRRIGVHRLPACRSLLLSIGVFPYEIIITSPSLTIAANGSRLQTIGRSLGSIGTCRLSWPCSQHSIMPMSSRICPGKNRMIWAITWKMTLSCPATQSTGINLFVPSSRPGFLKLAAGIQPLWRFGRSGKTAQMILNISASTSASSRTNNPGSRKPV